MIYIFFRYVFKKNEQKLRILIIEGKIWFYTVLLI